MNVDRENKLIHQVRLKDLALYRAGRLLTIKAQCGKRWAPTKFDSFEGKDQCPICFPKFAIAA